MNELKSLEGVDVPDMWMVAREARVSLAHVYAVAGGHESYSSNCCPTSVFRTVSYTYPVTTIRDAARRVAQLLRTERWSFMARFARLP